ncbi:CtsR family transcriptional regulator [Effusibacillus pohliae]|uniref:CtsR family transcriptional regulator n=1 Tax=Effusibacillus pohliae TaxID=232270 RepID=UPI00058D4245|nr:CtsR family transcriptional regulator [Effusibacillus pohliae]
MVLNISDIIEQYIKQMLKSGPSNSVEIQRSELADRFQCVPSQINYVISTRFTFEKGYVVESKRGGGGYIRIRKLDLKTDANALQAVIKLIGSQITQREAQGVIQRLREEGIITAREARMLEAAVSRDVLQTSVAERDQLRANLLSAMLRAILTG